MLSMENRQRLGLSLAIVGSVISCIGVVANNILLDHVLAMVIWRASNYIFVVYFFGNWRNWWDGGLSAGVMCVLYAVFAATNEWGLMNV
jgi:hypothetical protein